MKDNTVQFKGEYCEVKCEYLHIGVGDWGSYCKKYRQTLYSGDWKHERFRPCIEENGKEDLK